MNDNNELYALDEALDYLNEGKLLDRAKGQIRNIINSIQKDKPSKSSFTFGKKLKKNTTASATVKEPNFTINKVTSKALFDHLYETEALCAEGCNVTTEEEAAIFIPYIMNNFGSFPNEIKFYWCEGKDMNSTYHLTGDNKYPNNLHLFFIDWSNFPKNADIYKGKFRWFSDVVDNNARREIQSGNKYYENYHSIYGDEWFYSTI